MQVSETSDAGPFNVGTGVETSVNQLAKMIGIDATHGPAKAGEQRRSVLASKFGRTQLADGLRETVAWFTAR